MNRLANETSLYLRQHAGNPVDWYPWGPEALGRARAERLPILLSIGYSACHWCHVMAHESFEDPATAAVMNERFVNIKVDREERPDLDAIYMQAVQAMTGHGGWPMTVFLTPEGEPFWGGTYFPPEERHGMPSFRRILHAVSDAFAGRPEQVEQTVVAMRELYANAARSLPPGTLTPAVLAGAYRAAAQAFDERHGGFGGAPKFPPTMLLGFLLAHWARTGETRARTMAHQTFNAMSAGGIHDHVGGGFHRYSVDAQWLVPHFEKMLYDNALLARFGAQLWQATGDTAVRETTEGILRWLAREMTSPDGGFHSALDADSEGHEGRFYVWSAGELDALLGDDAAAVREWYGVTAGGNFEGANILNRPLPAANRLPPPAPGVVRRAIPVLLAARARRIRPQRDDKIITAWNALMLRGVAACARVFDSEEWRTLALRNATFLRDRMVRDGHVMRIWAEGEARIPGFLEDHAALALAFIDVWQLTGDRAWLDDAEKIARTMLVRFGSDDGTGFFDVPADHETLITRPRDVTDNAVPSGNSLACEALLLLAGITGDAALAAPAERALATLAEPLARHPHAFGAALCAADIAVHGTVAVAVTGERETAAAMVRDALVPYLPAAVIAAVAEGSHEDLALFAGRDARGGAAAAYVCRGTVCDAPAVNRTELAERLAALAPMEG